MQIGSPFNFDYSYLSLPDRFYSLVKPESAPKPEIFFLNTALCEQLNVASENRDDLLEAFFGQPATPQFTTFAQAYAGHQFGHFTRLGDGRAIVLGEHLAKDQERFDIQLKGSGRTPYSRGGDGKATLKAMLREYVMSEALHFLGIPTSRSLAVIKTGEPVYREQVQEGAALIRVMKSHIRVGTFQYAAHLGTTDDLKALTKYTVDRLYPEISQDENVALSLLRKVMEAQVALVANWMRIGFIHGVMNTDNTSISGETFDYGPCAFMNTFDPDTVYSSIDQNGRYSYGNQPKIIKWNIARFAEALLPIIDEDQEKSLSLAQKTIDDFDALWKSKYYETMLRKIGIHTNDTVHQALVDELLEMMKRLRLDYTNTFRDLPQALLSQESSPKNLDFQAWLSKWKAIVDKSGKREAAIETMNGANPFIIPRNHLVEQALDDAVSGDIASFERLLRAISNPYQFQNGLEDFRKPSGSSFERSYQTFCGT